MTCGCGSRPDRLRSTSAWPKRDFWQIMRPASVFSAVCNCQRGDAIADIVSPPEKEDEDDDDAD
jgi:hypothetical protein